MEYQRYQEWFKGLKRNIVFLGMVTNTYNPRTLETEAEKFEVWRQPELHSEILPKKCAHVVFRGVAQW